MAHKRRYSGDRKASRAKAPPPPPRERYAPVRQTPKQYAQPFILLEDANKGTFEFKAGQWVMHAMSIAECKETCLVKQLPQKVNGMTRYEIRYPISDDV